MRRYLAFCTASDFRRFTLSSIIHSLSNIQETRIVLDIICTLLLILPFIHQGRESYLHNEDKGILFSGTGEKVWNPKGTRDDKITRWHILCKKGVERICISAIRDVCFLA